MIAANHLRRVVIVSAPFLLIVFSLAHGLDWLVMHSSQHDDSDAFIRYIVEIRGRWLAVHVAGLALFPMLGIAVWYMLPANRISSRISKVGLAAYIVLYPAFDAIAGIGSAIVAEYRQGMAVDRQSIANDIIWALLGDADPTFYLAQVASYAWGLGGVAAAFALWQERGWRVGLPLGLGAVAMSFSHFPPEGAVAGVMLTLAAWQFSVRPAEPIAAVTDEQPIVM